MNPEQQRLLDKADRTLQAARVLCDQGFFDSAASRAYYVMFYTVTAFLESEKLSYSRGVAAATV